MIAQIHRFKLTKLNQSGFDHILGIVAFVALFAIAGSYLLVQSHAANWTGELQLGVNKTICLDNLGNSKTAKSPLDIFTCNGTQAQHWTINDLSTNTKEFTIKAAAANLCISDTGGAVGTNANNRVAVETATCSSTDHTQLWEWAGSGNHELENTSSHGCINDPNSTQTIRTHLIVYACAANPNMQWYEAALKATTGTGTGGGSSTTSSEAIITSLYADPATAPWTQVENAKPTVKYSIVNICAPDGTGSGCGSPADEKNPDWTSTLQALKTAGITPTYYISTNYGAVSLSVLESEIKNAISWYGVASPMFDTVAVSGNCSNGGSSLSCLTYYKDLYTYAVSAGATVVVFNPGTVPSSNYIFGPKEIIQVFEGTAADFAGSSFPSWMSQYSSGQFAATLSAGSSSTISSDVSHAVKEHIGNFYEDDEAEPPNYSTLPSYWTTEVQDVKAAQ